MKDAHRGFVVRRAESVDSTQAWAKRSADLECPVVFVASEQTGGIGRFARAWSSPRGGLWCTFAMEADAASLPARLEGLGIRVGVACLAAVRGAVARAGLSTERVRLKWPNDVMIGRKKVLGVLTEVVPLRHGTARNILVGVGLNANFSAAALPPDITASATTLLDETGRESDLDALLDDLAAGVRGALEGAGVPAESLAEARKSLFGLNQRVHVKSEGGGTARGVLLGLSNNGAAIVLRADGSVVEMRGGVMVHEWEKGGGIGGS